MGPGVTVRTSARAMFFDWERLGRVLVKDGKSVLVEPRPDSTFEDFVPFLTGPVLAVLLHQSGKFVLHASSVEINGRTVAFLGAKGSGKSTLAAYLKARGHRVISDDIVPLSFVGDEAWTLPGFPRVKLFADSLTAIGQNPADFPTIHRFVDKRSFELTGPFINEPSRLNAIYILCSGNRPRIKSSNKTNAFIEIIKNTHLNKFLAELNCQAEYFQFCRRLVQDVPVFSLVRSNTFNEIEQTGKQLESHVAKIHIDGKGPCFSESEYNVTDVAGVA